jgi:hypothetical protein
MGVTGNTRMSRMVFKKIHADKFELTDMTTDQLPQPERLSTPHTIRYVKRVTHKKYPRIRAAGQCIECNKKRQRPNVLHHRDNRTLVDEL